MANEPILKTNSKEAYIGKEYIRDDHGKIIGSRITARAYESLSQFEGDIAVIQLSLTIYGDDGKPTGTYYLTKCDGTYEAETAFEELRAKLNRDYYQSPARKKD